MKTKILILSLFLMLFISFVSAEVQTLGTFKKGECINLIQNCGNCTFNNISSIVYPNSTTAISNVEMTKQNTVYNYTFCNTNDSGHYIVNGVGDLNTIQTSWVYDFFVNPQGIESTQSRTETITRSIYFMFGISVILFIAFIFIKDKPPIRWTFFIFSVLFFVIGLNLIVVGMKDEVVNPALEGFFDGFTAISFYFYWFAASILILLWGFTFFNTYFYKQNIEKMKKFGGGEF